MSYTCKRMYQLNSKIPSSIRVLNMVLDIARDVCLDVLSLHHSHIPAIVLDLFPSWISFPSD